MLLGGGRSTSSNNGDRRSRLQVCIIGHEPLDVLTRDLSDQKGQIYGSAPYSSGHVSYGSCGWIPVLRISTLPRFWKNVTSNNACTRIKDCYAVGNPVGLMWCHGGWPVDLVRIDRRMDGPNFEMEISLEETR